MATWDKLNLSIADSLGTAKNVLNSEVSSLQEYFFTHFYLHVAAELDSVLIKEVSSFQKCPFRGAPL